MKLDSIIIPAEAPAIVAESTQRRLGKYQVLGSWACKSKIVTSGPAAPTSREDFERCVAEHGNWGEQDDGSHGRGPKMPTSIRLVLDPTLAQEGDE